jgi:hypothetical protein
VFRETVHISVQVVVVFCCVHPFLLIPGCLNSNVVIGKQQEGDPMTVFDLSIYNWKRNEK